jgi:hypothetical protein
VRGDPQRIVALGPGQPDALCALGLQSRVVGTAVPQPSYLGTVLHDAPAVGDLDAVRAAGPDLILGSASGALAEFGQLAELAPTVFTGADWRDSLRGVAAATGRAAPPTRCSTTSTARPAPPGNAPTPPTSKPRWCSSPRTPCECSARRTSRPRCWPPSAWIVLRTTFHR